MKEEKIEYRTVDYGCGIQRNHMIVGDQKHRWRVDVEQYFESRLYFDQYYFATRDEAERFAEEAREDDNVCEAEIVDTEESLVLFGTKDVVLNK